MRVVVGAAIVRDGRALVARRDRPAALAGMVEFPGGKVEPGEDEAAALVRECREELGVDVRVGPRLGPDLVPHGGEGVLRVYVATLVSGEPEAREHAEVRWAAAGELDALPWIPVDRELLPALRALLDPAAGGDRP